jgi:hypothetical protein
VYSNPFVAQLVAKETIEDSMRHAEHARLVRAVEGDRKPWRWQLPKLSAFKSRLTPVLRLQFRRRVKA